MYSNVLKEMKMIESIRMDEAVICLAASVTGRAKELILDGWVQGALSGGTGEASEFCVQGALALAIEEACPGFGGNPMALGRELVCAGVNADRKGVGPIEAIATAFIVQEAAERFGWDQDSWMNGRLGAAEWNDGEGRSQEQVVQVIDAAVERIWALLDDVDPAQFVDEELEDERPVQRNYVLA